MLGGSNQFRLANNAEDLDEVFSARLQSLPKDGYVIAMLDRWNRPREFASSHTHQEGDLLCVQAT